jgi:uncharacterized protein
MNNRIGDWIETYTGRKFFPLDPRPEDIELEDIAHALSNKCRYNGHCKTFYSVAQHTVLGLDIMEKEGYDTITMIHFALHDSAEAYLPDVSRPIKPYIKIGNKTFEEVEEEILVAVRTRFCIPEPTQQQNKLVKHIDTKILFHEANYLMPCNDWGDKSIQFDYINVAPVPIHTIKREYIRKFNTLLKQYKKG